MIDNTALLKARVKMIVSKKQTGAVPIARPKPVCRTSQSFRQYSAQARLIVRDISELRDLVLDKRKEYILCSGSLATYSFTNVMSEADRLRFENDSATALKQCTKLVQFFQTQINSDRSLWREDEQRHLRFVSQLLDTYLRQIAALIEQLRSIYRRQSERMRKICRLANLVEKYERSIDDAYRSERARVDAAQRRRDDDAENIAPTGASRWLTTEVTKKSTSRSDTDNRRVLQLNDDDESSKKTQRVRVYDFTSEAPRTRLHEPKEGGTVTAPSVDGWSELDDATLFASATVDSGRETDRFTVGGMSSGVPDSGDNDEGQEGWSDADLDFSLDEASFTANTALTAIQDSSTSRKANKKSEKLDAPAVSATADERPPDEPLALPELSRVEQEQLVLENRKLFDRFAHHDEDILHIGQQLTEIERLQNTFAQKVSEQEHNIDNIHTQTIYTLDNLEMANQFIRDAIKNSASRRVVALFCLLVLTFTLLFLDWYNP